MTEITDWKIGNPASRWSSELAFQEWNVGAVTLSQSHLSLEYVLIPVSANKAGVAYNPTSDTVQFAFMPTPTQVPQVSDWQSGAWDTVASDVIFPYRAKCLVGPGGTIALTVGSYVIYLKITDSPEVPVRYAGILEIT